MASIDPVSTGLYFSAANNSLKTNKKEDGKVKKHFSSLLKKAQEEEPEFDSEMPPEIAGMPYEEAVTFLLDRVTMAADNLKRSPLGNTFPEYRQKVSQFMKFIVKKSYVMEEQRSARTSMIKRPKKFYLIKVVDEKLEQLAKDILYNQTDQLLMLSKMNEINGMLVDLIS